MNPWKLALEGSGDGVWDLDMEADTLTRSARWNEMLGYSDQDLPGNRYSIFAELVHPNDWPAILKAHEDYFAQRLPRFQAEFRIRCMDGRWKWILSRGMVVQWNSAGQPSRMIGTHTDIDAHRQTQQRLEQLNTQLRKQRDYLDTTLSSVSQGIFLSDRDGHIHTFNAQLCELLQLDPNWLKQNPTRQALSDLQH